MSRGITFARDELALFHEAATYGLKRTFTEAEKVRLAGLQSRLEERVLGAAEDEQVSFALTEPEAAVLTGAVDTYCEALDLPLAAEVSRRKARQLRMLIDRMHERAGFIQRLRKLFGRN